MGLFDFIKNTAIKVKCAAGFHAGEYRSIEGKPKCHVEKVCPDCGEYVTSFNHTWSGWVYERDNDCTMTETCKDCGKISKKIYHEFYDEDPREYGNCRIDKTCRRCGDKKIGEVNHLWQHGCEYPDEIYYFCCNCEAKKYVKKEKTE